MFKLRCLFLLILLTKILSAQNITVDKIEPPFWWEGIKLDTLQLMIYGGNLKDAEVKSESEIFNPVKTYNSSNQNYLFANIPTDKLVHGKYKLIISKDGSEKEIIYEIKEREFSPESHKGFGREDVIYLIFTDRFADGDTLNDKLPNKYEEFPFGDLNGRHGGDIQGMINHLDYIKNLGATAIWHTPVLENNMYMSYHGYAATDLYKIDPRFGSNNLYKKFISEAHKRGLKVILDHVNNHIGMNHIWGKNPPFEDWFHGTIEHHPEANHNKIAYFDIHGDPETPGRSQEGWFTDYMPDLNKDNPFLAKYMIQNTIWWIEFSGVDGIREDTYPYNELDYMSDWAKSIFDNYPNFNIVGEVWKGVPAFLSRYQKNPKIKSGFDSNLKTITDFAFSESVRNYLSGSGGMWGIYETLAKDFLYRYPEMMMTFLDNHDVDRAMFAAKNDLAKFKIALTLLLTTRGIPQITYGTEIGMNGGGHHGKIRAPFPGGFPGDKRNAFTPEGRTKKENEIFNLISRLLQLRKEYPALSTGKLIHYPPKDGIYVYFRMLKTQKIMIAVNASDKNKTISLKDYSVGEGFASAEDLLNNYVLKLNGTSSVKLTSKSAQVFLLNPDVSLELKIKN